MTGARRTPSPDQVQRGADALAAWINPSSRVAWAEQAARIVLDAALAPEGQCLDTGSSVSRCDCGRHKTAPARTPS